MTQEQIQTACENACMHYPDDVAVIKILTPFAVTLLSSESMRFAHCIPDATAKDTLVYVPASEKTCRALFEGLKQCASLVYSIASI